MLVQIAIAHAPQDEDACRTLKRHLAPLKEKVSHWCPAKVSPGDITESTIAENFRNAKLVVFLLSPELLELLDVFPWSTALDLNQRRVPVLLRFCWWELSALGRLELLPRNKIPVKKWPSPDEAWLEVARELAALLEGDQSILPAPSVGLGDNAILLKHISEAPPAQRMLVKDPGECPSMAQAGQEIDAIGGFSATPSPAPDPPRPSPRWRWLAAAALIMAAAVGALGLRSPWKIPPGRQDDLAPMSRPPDLAVRPPDLAPRLLDLAPPSPLPPIEKTKTRGEHRAAQTTRPRQQPNLLDIEFVCVDFKGMGIKGVKIVCGGASCMTDARGRCRIAGVPVPQRCSASLAGDQTQEVTITGATARVSITLPPPPLVPPG